MFLLLILAALLPTEDVVRERVDLIETNHFYDDQGRLVFDQLLFYEWSNEDARHQLLAWRMVKNSNQIPEYSHGRKVWSATFKDGDVLRRIDAGYTRETITQYDPELSEREHLPKEKRRELRPLGVGSK